MLFLDILYGWKIPTEQCLLIPVLKAFSFIYGTAVVSVCTDICLPREEFFNLRKCGSM